MRPRLPAPSQKDTYMDKRICICKVASGVELCKALSDSVQARGGCDRKRLMIHEWGVLKE